jgi:hypothetical protein
MRRQPAHFAEVIRRFDEAATEVILPDAIDGDAPGERVIPICNPIGECGTTGSFGVIRRQLESAVYARHGWDRPWADFETGFRDIAASEKMNWPRFAAVRPRADERATASMNCTDKRDTRRWEKLQFAISIRAFREQCSK